MSVPAVIELEEVSRTYRMGPTEVHALAGVTLQIDRASFWAVMGPSGSGKSTFLNLLGCLDRPTGGCYLLEGEEVGGLEDDVFDCAGSSVC